MRINKIISISFLLILFGCEGKKATHENKVDNKSYFACIDYEFDPNIESVLYIDTNKKRIEVAGLEWENYSQDEQKIYGKIQGYGYDNTINFNFVTGRLKITMSNYFEEGSTMAKHNGVKSFYYECRKTNPML